jgi:hypothetical protein
MSTVPFLLRDAQGSPGSVITFVLAAPLASTDGDPFTDSAANA